MSEHIGAEEAQALLDAVQRRSPHDWSASDDQVTYEEGLWIIAECVDAEVAELIAAAPRLAAEVVRLRRELDARTDQPTAKELLHAVDIQYRAAPPKLPETWTRTEVAHYRHGWLDAMQRVKDSTDTAAAARLLGGGE